jgi:hypothetical protein
MMSNQEKEPEQQQVEKQKIVEWKGDPLRPKMVWEGEGEIFDGAVQVECPDKGEVSIHVTRDSADGPIASAYMTPAEAYILAERVRLAAWIAEMLAASSE